MNISQFLNWRTYLVFAALCIVAASLLYTSQLASKLAVEERKKVALFAEGIKSIANAKNDEEISFVTNVITQDSTIPRIITDEKGLIQDIKAIDTFGMSNVPLFLKNKITEYKKLHTPIVVQYQFGNAYIYYGESYLLTRLRYFPYAQLAIIALFLLVVVIAIRTTNRSIQNQVWVGLSKETAHQLGTPISSIEGWMEILRNETPQNTHLAEMQKDIDRLKLVADRFSKVGSDPKLEIENLVPRLREMVDYMKKRAPGKVFISLENNQEFIEANISGPLFDWVIENLIRNALDAMEGSGSIVIQIQEKEAQVIIDVLDNGKGIPAHQLKKVFNPGFTTKKRGWGLGLSLSKRIIEKYHHGSIFVKQSELKKGTTFRIVFDKI
ncbi:MAG: HAMP domain-containing sensor histidine kinase [Phycisphaerales bacterium]|nr:HAMP domain-containing sensor histidine kinase [Phycisphaerales bacterium]